MSVMSGYTMKYSLSLRKIPWALPLEFYLSSGYISLYIPPLDTNNWKLHKQNQIYTPARMMTWNLKDLFNIEFEEQQKS